MLLYQMEIACSYLWQFKKDLKPTNNQIVMNFISLCGWFFRYGRHGSQKRGRHRVQHAEDIRTEGCSCWLFQNLWSWWGDICQRETWQRTFDPGLSVSVWWAGLDRNLRYRGCVMRIVMRPRSWMVFLEASVKYPEATAEVGRWFT